MRAGLSGRSRGAVAVVCGCVVPWGVLYHVDIGLQNMLTGALSVENFSLYKRGSIINFFSLCSALPSWRSHFEPMAP